MASCRILAWCNFAIYNLGYTCDSNCTCVYYNYRYVAKSLIYLIAFFNYLYMDQRNQGNILEINGDFRGIVFYRDFDKSLHFMRPSFIIDNPS